MELIHITSIENAISILKSRTFYIEQTIPEADQGLNAFIDEYPNMVEQCFSGTGAAIIFEWLGAQERTDNLKSGILLLQYFEYPHSFWRAHLRPPIPENSLKIIRIEVSEENKKEYSEIQLDNYLNGKWYRRFLSKKTKEKLKEQFRNTLEKDLVIDEDCFISFSTKLKVKGFLRLSK